MKHVLSIQDLSCLGKCSLTVALPVLSAMGCACSVLPTAVLSTHTAFPDPHIRSLTEDIPSICNHWKTTGVTFDAVTVGYLADPVQAAAVQTVLDAFPGLVIVDPVMGDNGRLYTGIGTEHLAAVSRLCKHGNILLPNLTEAAMLTGLSYEAQPSQAQLRSLLDGMLERYEKTVIITGACAKADATGFVGWSKQDGYFCYEAARIPRQLHGTGDLFAAVFTGALMRGRQIPQAASLAARFVERVITATADATPFGVEFEPQLSWLWEQLNEPGNVK